MLYLALSLGFFGSLHCMGMCGPLAFNVSINRSRSLYNTIVNALSYNMGRILTYTLLGLLFGFIGNVFNLTSTQKWISIALGVFFIISFLIAKTPERLFLNTSVGKSINNTTYQLLNGLLKRSKTTPTFMIGMVNGLLPCGLVYVAISGALMATSHIGGMQFMLYFGLGTLPMMFIIMLLPTLGSKKSIKGFNKVLPYVNLLFGIFLIYRALAVNLPLDLNFMEAVDNPIMCH